MLTSTPKLVPTLKRGCFFLPSWRRLHRTARLPLPIPGRGRDVAKGGAASPPARGKALIWESFFGDFDQASVLRLAPGPRPSPGTASVIARRNAVAAAPL